MNFPQLAATYPGQLSKIWTSPTKSFFIKHEETSLNERPLWGYNCHDCHVLLRVFLPIAIRAIASICEDGNYSVVLSIQQDFSKGDQRRWIEGSLRIYWGDYGTARDVLPSRFFWYNGAPNDSHGRPDMCTWSTLPTRNMDLWVFHVPLPEIPSMPSACSIAECTISHIRQI